MAAVADVTLCECFARDGLQHEPQFVLQPVTREALAQGHVRHGGHG